MKRDRPGDDRPRTLPPQRAFVVHFCASEPPGRVFEGRVEHLSSGRAVLFRSRAALLAFFVALLDPPRDA